MGNGWTMVIVILIIGYFIGAKWPVLAQRVGVV